MFKILDYILSSIVYIVVYLFITYIILFIFPIYYAEYKSKDFLNSVTKENVIVFYDDFKHDPTMNISHREAVEKTFLLASEHYGVNLDGFDIISLNYNDEDFTEFITVVKKLKEKNKNIFVNLSFAPTDEFGAKFLYKNIQRLADNKTIFFLSSGNNDIFLNEKPNFNSLHDKFSNYLSEDDFFPEFIYDSYRATALLYSLSNFIGFTDNMKKIKEDLKKIGQEKHFNSFASFLYTSQYYPKNKFIHIVGGCDPKISKNYFIDDVADLKCDLNSSSALDFIFDTKYYTDRASSLITIPIGDKNETLSGTSFSTPIVMAKFLRSYFEK